MITPQSSDVRRLRISIEDIKPRLQTDEPATVLGVRNQSDWESSPVKVRAASSESRHLAPSTLNEPSRNTEIKL